jgi:hypothetical protein
VAADHHRLCTSVVVTNETLMRVMEDARSAAFDHERRVRTHRGANAMPTSYGSPQQNDRVESVNDWSYGSEGIVALEKSKLMDRYNREQALRLSALVFRE